MFGLVCFFFILESKLIIRQTQALSQILNKAPKRRKILRWVESKGAALHTDHVQLVDLFCHRELDAFEPAPGLGQHKPRPLPENKPAWINCEGPGNKHPIHQLSWKSRRDESHCQSRCHKGISLRHSRAGEDEPGGRQGDGSDGAQQGCRFAAWSQETSARGATLSGGNLSTWCFGPLPVGKDSTVELRGQTEALCVKADLSAGRKGTEELLGGSREGTQAASCPGRTAWIALGTLSWELRARWREMRCAGWLVGGQNPLSPFPALQTRALIRLQLCTCVHPRAHAQPCAHAHPRAREPLHAQPGTLGPTSHQSGDPVLCFFQGDFPLKPLIQPRYQTAASARPGLTWFS